MIENSNRKEVFPISHEYIRLPVQSGNFHIFLAPKVAKERIRYAIPTSVFTTVCRSISKAPEKMVSFFNLEHNILLYVRYIEPDNYVFEDVKVLNYDSTGIFRPITPDENTQVDPVFLKSYVDGRKVFIDNDLITKIKKLSVDTRVLAFEDLVLDDGFYSTFLPNNTNLVVDFFVYGGDIFVSDVIKPTYLKFGLYLFQN